MPFFVIFTCFVVATICVWSISMPGTLRGCEPVARHALNMAGASLSEGIALGHVVLHEPRVVITNVIADDAQKELKRLDQAITKLRDDLDRMLEHGDVIEGGEHRDVLEAYRMFANDHGWSHKLHEAVATGLTAEAAVERVQSDTRARMLRSTDPYLRDRLHDLEDLGHRLMRQLVGQDHAPSREQLPENAILIARAMGPAALLEPIEKARRLLGTILDPMPAYALGRGMKTLSVRVARQNASAMAVASAMALDEGSLLETSVLEFGSSMSREARMATPLMVRSP